VKAAAERLEVVRDDDEGACGDKHEEPRIDRESPNDADRHGGGDRDNREPDEHACWNLRAERSPVQLVECMRPDAHRESECDERRPETGDGELRAQGGSDGHEGEVPGGIGRVQERDVVAPTA
jgi:hypothetical protein